MTQGKSEPGHPSGPGPRVAQLIETMDMGGAENLAVQIANDLACRGYRSHLIVMTGPGPLSGRIAPEVQVHYLDYWRASIRNPLAFLASIRRGRSLLHELIHREGISLVQTHLPGANFWGLSLRYSRQCEVLATIHNNQEFRYGEVDARLLLNLRKYAYRQIVKRCAGTIAVSDKVKRSLLADLGLGPRWENRITVVSNGVEIPQSLTAENRQRLRTSFGVDETQGFVLAAGRLGEQKNFRDLVQAAAHLKSWDIPFRLVIAGEGEQKELLEMEIRTLALSGQVVLAGNVPNLREVMQAADVFAMSSLWEGLPLVLLEAMAARLAAVAYEIPGVVELIEDGRTGHLARVGDPEHLARRLAGLLTDPSARRQVAKRGHELVAAHYNFQDLMDRVCSLYARVVA